MTQEIYTLSREAVMSRIMNKTGYSKEDIEKKVKEVVKDMDGLINDDGATYIVANNLGISITDTIDKEVYNIDKPYITIDFCRACKRFYDGDLGSVLFNMCDNCLCSNLSPA